MFIADISVKRPIFATVLMLTLVTLGAFSYNRLSIEMMPNVEIPVISIITIYQGASPESVEREVSKKIEEAVNPIAGVKHVSSYSREGVSTVVVEFQLEVKINDAVAEARAKINAIRGDLPKDIEDPIINKMDIGGQAILSLAVFSDNLSQRDLTEIIEKRIKRQIENTSGVGKVDLVGESKKAVNVIVDPRRLAALNMGVNEVIAGLQSENVNTPLGRYTAGASEFPMRVDGKPEQVRDFSRMVIAQREGRPITVGDVADIDDGIEEQRSLALVNGKPAIAMDILKQTGANTVDVIDAVVAKLDFLRKQLPPGTTIEVVRDDSGFIRDSVEDVVVTMIIGGILTVLIVFCFLNSWRSTLITGLTLPISVIATFSVMYFGGMTLNVLTLMALSLAIGLLIDDAIVVRENIVRHLERGEDHFTAARQGTDEIGLAVIATSLSIMAVFIPVAFMRGIIGRFFYSFGITVAFAVLVSLFVSFTLDPMLSSRWYDPDIERKGRRNWLARLLDRFNEKFDSLAEYYQKIIAWSLDNPLKIIGLAILAFVVGIALLGALPQEFQTKIDEEKFAVSFKTSPQSSIEESRDRLEAVLATLKRIPEVAQTYATIGAGDNGTVRDVFILVNLTPKAERKRHQLVIMDEARELISRVPGIQGSVGSADEGPGGGKPLQVSVRGENIDKLKIYASELKKSMYAIAGVVDLDMTMEQTTDEYRLTVNRERAMDAGVNTNVIASTLNALVGGQKVSTYEDEDGDAREVRVRLPEDLRADPSQLGLLRLAVQKGEGATGLVPLSDLVDYKLTATPSEINRKDLSREITVSANTANIALGTAVEKTKLITDKMQMDPGYFIVFGGEDEIMKETMGYMLEALLLAVILVYLILAAQFESFVAPLSIMFSLPLSIVGMAGLLTLTRDTVNIMSQIGLIMLMGLVVKNAILLIDFAKHMQSETMSRREALIEAGRIRLRPILMTTLAMIFGMLPLALGLGAGAELRSPMARAVVGGLITSTILTLVVVPVIYEELDDLSIWFKSKFKSKRRHGEEAGE